MKDAFLFLLLAAVAYLIYDDYSKRDAMKQMQTQVQQLTYERDQARRGAVSYAPRIQATPATPAWFQEHLKKGSSLEESKPHYHRDEQGASTPFPSPH
jgi:hypothetical protein